MVGDHAEASSDGRSSAGLVKYMSIALGFDRFHLVQSGERVRGLSTDVRGAERVAHDVVRVVVRVPVAKVVDIEYVSTPLVGGAQPGLLPDVGKAGLPEHVCSRMLDQFVSVA